jgi:hypothetical protein
MDPEDESLEFERDQYQRDQQERDEKRGRELLSTIDFGLQVQAFLDGEIGQQILKDAEEQVLDLMKALVDLDPEKREDRDQIRHIRQKIGILNHWQDAFAGYILAGRQAELELQETD